ncbi:AAA family ATPase, partial [Thauera aromatica]|uniref:AAA family ATPase n=1 Tax=Thauera aromatica TaxID=59405 RepID=UPI001FFCE700
RDLYSVIKDSDAHIRFAMLTGVSKFSKVSLFSGLNNLRDITLSAAYSSICGYTDEDVDTVFAPELLGLDREAVRTWYNGYNWTGTAVYNPFDLLLLFQEREFRPYWFETGTPTFLVDLLTERQAWLPALSQLETDLDLLSSFEVDNIATEALMFQTGYLTIDEEINLSGNWFYRLRYPNREVFQ